MTNNEYITVCDKCRRKTWYETEQQCHCNYPDTKICNLGHRHVVSDKMIRCTGTLRLIDNSQLDSRFDYAFKNNKRVELIYNDGTKSRFWVGKSTGWKPVYLEIKTKRSCGGAMVYAPPECRINVLY